MGGHRSGLRTPPGAELRGREGFLMPHRVCWGEIDRGAVRVMERLWRLGEVGETSGSGLAGGGRS